MVVAGVITSGCVESTARDAYFRNYYVVLPGDASGSYSRERHDAALRKLALTFGVVTQTDDVARLWSHAAAGPRGWQLDAKRAQVLHTLEQLTDPAHAALVIVDMQNDFCHPDGLMGKRGEDLSHNRDITLFNEVAQWITQSNVVDSRPGAFFLVFFLRGSHVVPSFNKKKFRMKMNNQN